MLVVYVAKNQNFVELEITAKDGSKEIVKVFVSRSASGNQAWLAFDADKQKVKISNKILPKGGNDVKDGNRF